MVPGVESAAAQGINCPSALVKVKFPLETTTPDRSAAMPITGKLGVVACQQPERSPLQVIPLEFHTRISQINIDT